MKMKIALVNHSLGSGGAEKLIHDMAIEMKNRGEDVSVILLTSKTGVYNQSLLEKEIEVICLSDNWDIYSPKNIFRLVKVLKEYDVVHTHTYASQLWVACASYFLPKNIRYITTEHNTSNNRRGKWCFKILDKWMYSKYDKIVSITKATEDNLKNWLEEKNKQKYFIVANGIKLQNFINAKKIEKTAISKEIKESDIILTMVARFSEQKDHLTPIRALKELKENIKLILVGEGNSEPIKKEIIKLNLENRVIFLGFRQDVPNILKSSDISVLSSHWEGFGLVAAESMATGVPTIVSDVEGLKDVVENGGLLFEKSNFKELALKIEKLLENRGFYEEISKKGIEKSKSYSIENTVEKYLKIYKS